MIKSPLEAMIFFILGVCVGGVIGWSSANLNNIPNYQWCQDRSRVRMAYTAGLHKGFELDKQSRNDDAYQDGFEDGIASKGAK